MARTTKAERKRRREAALVKISDGHGFADTVTFVMQEWGCSRRNARRVVSDAHKEWMDVAFGAEDIDQCDLLFQCVARLEPTARKAEEACNYACVIGCFAQLNRMMALGADQKGFRGHPTHYYRR